MMRAGRLAVAAVVCLVGCKEGPEPRNSCAPLSPGRYTFVLTYTGETTFDGGCPPDHAFDGQTITVLLENGAVTVSTATQTLSCFLTSWGYDGLVAHCPLPATNDQLQVFMSASCDDSGVGAGAVDLVNLDDASFDQLSAACTESYSAQ